MVSQMENLLKKCQCRGCDGVAEWTVILTDRLGDNVLDGMDVC
jgi:hypothetical protein